MLIELVTGINSRDITIGSTPKNLFGSLQLRPRRPAGTFSNRHLLKLQSIAQSRLIRKWSVD